MFSQALPRALPAVGLVPGAGGDWSSGALGQWLDSLDVRQRRALASRVTQRANAMKQRLAATLPARDSADLRAAAVFVEFAEHAGISPVELYSLMSDPRREAQHALASLMRAGKRAAAQRQ
ncbi:MAG: hypothetical protein SFZ23_08090 [Planctomycetota bacterium]|nr:hypothetical protein [Planctomycetota bacterium]